MTQLCDHFDHVRVHDLDECIVSGELTLNTMDRKLLAIVNVPICVGDNW